MVSYIEESRGGDFRPTPEGVHRMVCTRVVDLGTQKTEFNGEVKYQRKIMIGWELPDERVTIDGRDAPAVHTERYTWSFHEKANLRRTLEQWRGRKFTADEFGGPPNGFTVTKLIGVPCNGQVMHETGGNGRTYANLSTVMKYTGPRETWPAPEGDTILVDLDDFQPAEYAKLTDYWKGVIATSPEGMALGLTPPAPREAGAQQQPTGGRATGGAPAARPDFDDEVPF